MLLPNNPKSVVINGEPFNINIEVHYDSDIKTAKILIDAFSSGIHQVITNPTYFLIEWEHPLSKGIKKEILTIEGSFTPVGLDSFSNFEFVCSKPYLLIIQEITFWERVKRIIRQVKAKGFLTLAEIKFNKSLKIKTNQESD